jgi:O-antigen ligase/tetratricopeptide (TPR) repeat protein
VSRLERSGEVLILALVCLAPWAFGAVEAWAELLLDLGIVALGLIALIVGIRSGRRPSLLGLPGLALLGLLGLSLFQSAPLPETWLRRLSPVAAEERVELAPRTAVRVHGDPGGAIAPPARTLSEDPDASMRAAARLAAAWVLFQAVVALGGGTGALRVFGTAVAVDAALLAIFSLIQAATWNGKIYWIRPSPMGSGWNSGGPFVGHSPLAAELNVGLGFALAFLLTPGGRRRSRPWAAYAASLIAVGVVASHSRTGVLAMAVTAVVFAAALHGGKYRPGAGVWVGLAAILVLIPLLLFALGRTSPLRRIGTMAEASSYAPRLEVWRHALGAWRERPIWGSGLGTFATATMPQFTRDEGIVYTRAENEYLDLLVEGGVVGLGLLLLGLGAVARAGREAVRRASSARDRFVVLGALFGLVSLAIHSLSDFALHLPAVGVTTVVLAALVRGVAWGADAGRRPPGAVDRPRASSALAWAAAGCALLVPMAFVLLQGVSLARAEAALGGTGLPLPGSAMPDVQAENLPTAELEKRRAGLERALRLRPDWAEGHLRLGLAELGLYRANAREWLGDTAGDAGDAVMLASPLWLHGVVHTGGGGDRERRDPAALAEHEPIRRHLLPAARSFLEARRCCPRLALAHAELAQLDYLVDGGEPASVHAARALRLARGSADLLDLAARAALQAGEVDLACGCWRAALAARPAGWRAIADAAGVVLTPETILDRVLTPGSGRLPVQFAERLYADPEDAAVRVRYHRAALQRLASDADLPSGERLALEARAFAALGEAPTARRRMAEALRLEPGRTDRRLQLILWLIEWDDPAEARRQAVVGIHLDPGSPDLKRALEAAAEALARGNSSSATGG